MKVSDILFVLNKFNSFDKNLKFIVDTFDSSKVHFLDLEISQSGINIFGSQDTQVNDNTRN